MKFIAIQSNIKEAIFIIERMVGNNQNLPILKNVFIKAENDSIVFTTTNLEVAITHYISGKVIEGGQITIPVSLLANIIGNIKSDRLNFETKGNILEVKTDNYSATIQGLSVDDFPPIPK